VEDGERGVQNEFSLFAKSENRDADLETGVKDEWRAGGHVFPMIPRVWGFGIAVVARCAKFSLLGKSENQGKWFDGALKDA